MNTLTLKRRHFDHGTYSTIHTQNGKQVCCMVECPWQNNLPNVSCVPPGTYKLIPHQSNKFGTCYALEAPTLGVTRYGPSIRTHCLIHKANRASWSMKKSCLNPASRLSARAISRSIGLWR